MPSWHGSGQFLPSHDVISRYVLKCVIDVYYFLQICDKFNFPASDERIYKKNTLIIKGYVLIYKLLIKSLFFIFLNLLINSLECNKWEAVK
jgi:hypothetical protein